ncbi:MAG: glycosyltransferase family 4 protein [Hyphomicrobiaceae bacterium]|nr:glycosyltransferase family 4 protein [Hyphomicrobiaceae bacterium]
MQGETGVAEARAPPAPDRVVVINDLSAVRGGATGIALASIGALRSRGLFVTLVTGDEPSGPGSSDLADSVAAVGSPHILDGAPLAGMARGLFNAKAARVLADWIARHDTPATVYHLHGWSKILSPAVFGALRPVAARLVLHAHDFFLSCPNGGYFDFRRGEPCALRPLGASCLARHCDRRNYAHKLWRAARLGIRHAMLDASEAGRVLVVHEAMIPLFRRGGLGGARFGVLRNPVEPWCSRRVEAERNRLFLYVGRLDEDKGADLLARAARRAGVPLRMIGAGPLAARLAREHPEVELSGWRSRGEIARLCREARAVIVPTRSRETFGIAGLEAVMSGLPVAVSRNALMAEEIAEGGFGLVCDPGDIDAMSMLLTRLARDDRLVAGMSAAAYARARRLAPTPEQWTDSLLGIYAALLDAAGSPAAGACGIGAKAS